MMTIVAVTLAYIFMLSEFIYRHAKSKKASRQYDLLAWAKICCCCCSKRKRQSVDSSHRMDDANKTEAGFTASNEGEQEGEDRKFVNLVLCTLIVATVLIVVRYVLCQFALETLLHLFFTRRSVYRCIEMLNFQPNHPGAYGDQTLFLVLDSAFMVSRWN